MKKYLLMCLMIVFCLQNLASPVSANTSINSEEKAKQAEIDELFTRLNEIVSEQKHLEHLATLTNAHATLTTSEIQTKLTNYQEKTTSIENQIESLGVQKLDPKNKDDMDILNEMFSAQTLDEQNNTLAVPSPPDLSAVASVFTLYRYQGTYEYSGTTYDYSYIRVVDNKGYNRLYSFNEFDAAPKNATQSTIQAVMRYTFGFAFGQLLGTHPVGIAADWTMNAAISGMKAYDTTKITSTSDAFYRIFASSTTSMTYYWIYHSNAWKFMGSDATFAFTKSDFAAFNYQGQPKHISQTQPTWSSSSGYTWYKYIENFHANKWNSNYEQINKLGSFTIKGYQTSVIYTPKFVNYPGYL